MRLGQRVRVTRPYVSSELEPEIVAQINADHPVGCVGTVLEMDGDILVGVVDDGVSHQWWRGADELEPAEPT